MILFKLPTRRFSVIPKKPWINIVKLHSIFLFLLNRILSALQPMPSLLFETVKLVFIFCCKMQILRCPLQSQQSSLTLCVYFVGCLWISSSLQSVVCNKPQYLQIFMWLFPICPCTDFLQRDDYVTWQQGNNIYRLHDWCRRFFCLCVAFICCSINDFA